MEERRKAVGSQLRWIRRPWLVWSTADEFCTRINGRQATSGSATQKLLDQSGSRFQVRQAGLKRVEAYAQELGATSQEASAALDETATITAYEEDSSSSSGLGGSDGATGRPNECAMHCGGK